MTDFAEGSETAAELMPRSVFADVPFKEVTGDTHRAEVSAELPREVAWRVVNREEGQPEFVPPRFDPVQRPAHYASGDIECIDAIRAALGDEAFVAYCRGNAIKYAWRTGKKANHAEDLRKGAWYLERAASVLEEARDA